MRLRDFPTPWCSWRDLYVVVATALRYPSLDDPLALAVLGPSEAWSPRDLLAASQVDNSTFLAWTKTKDAADHPNRPPKPIPRPGVQETAEVKHFGSDPVPLDELADWLGWEMEMG